MKGIICGRNLALIAVSILYAQPGLPQANAVTDGEYSARGADTCIACHGGDEILAMFHTPHGVPGDSRSPFGPGQLQCESCHGPGAAHAGRVRRGQERPPVIRFAADSEASIEDQNGMCMGCHQADLDASWHGSAHDVNEIACASCHQVHVSRDPVLVTATQPDVCFDCHQQQRSQALKAYSHPFRAGKMDCSGCHSPHGGSSDTLFARQTLNDTCFECHAEKRGPYLWEHAPVAEDCSSCHDPHGSNNPGMVSLRGPMLCQSCHSQEGHQSFAYDSGGLADGSASKFLLGRNCMNCHTQVHGSNHPSGSRLMR